MCVFSEFVCVQVGERGLRLSGGEKQRVAIGTKMHTAVTLSFVTCHLSLVSCHFVSLSLCHLSLVSCHFVSYVSTESRSAID